MHECNNSASANKVPQALGKVMAPAEKTGKFLRQKSTNAVGGRAGKVVFLNSRRNCHIDRKPQSAEILECFKNTTKSGRNSDLILTSAYL